MSAALWASNSAGQTALPPQSDVPITGCMISGGHNTHVTQNCVFTVDMVPKVLLSKRGFDTQQAPSGNYIHALMFRLSFADSMRITVCGDENFISFFAGPNNPSGVMAVMGSIALKKDANNCMTSYYSDVAGRWVISVGTVNPDDKFTVQMAPG